MKIKTILFALLLFAGALQAQEGQQFVQLIQNDSGLYRFQRMEVRVYETLTDTLITERFPAKWLNANELKTYQVSLITALTERQNEQRRLLKLTKDEVALQVGFYDQINGDGAWLTYQKAKVLEYMQGNWVLIERSGETTKTDITVAGNDFRKNAQKFGTITVTDDLQILLVGYFSFDPTLAIAANGTLRVERNGRLFTLRRP